MSKKITNTILVHDRIINIWWAEMVLEELLWYFWDDLTVVYALLSKERTFKWKPVIHALPRWLNNFVVNASSSRWKIKKFLFDYRNLMPFYPLLVWLLRQKIKKTQANTMIVSSFVAVKNIQTSTLGIKNSILYCHSPMQYIWENYDEYTKKITWCKWLLFKFSAWYLRKRDRTTAPYTQVYANSYYSKKCVKQYYWLDATVWYPSLPKQFIETPALPKPFTYYLFVWRVVKFVRELDKIITMCNTLHLPLLVMGTWPDMQELQELAWPTVTFIGFVADVEQKATIISQAKAVINLAKESCGIGTMEALSLWVPVLWYNTWWTKELVHKDTWGTLVETKEIESLIDALQDFHQQQRDRPTIKKEFLSYYNDNRPTLP